MSSKLLPLSRYRPIISLSKFVMATPGAAGVFEVGDIDAHAGARLAFGAEGDAGFDGGIFEGAVALVAIKLVGLRVVGDKQIGPTIAVLVQQSHAERF